MNKEARNNKKIQIQIKKLKIKIKIKHEKYVNAAYQLLVLL